MLWLSPMLVVEGLLDTDRLCGRHSCCFFHEKTFGHDTWAITVALESFIYETEALSSQGWSIRRGHLLSAGPRLALFSCCICQRVTSVSTLPSFTSLEVGHHEMHKVVPSNLTLPSRPLSFSSKTCTPCLANRTVHVCVHMCAHGKPSGLRNFTAPFNNSAKGVLHYKLFFLLLYEEEMIGLLIYSLLLQRRLHQPQ